MVPQPQQPTVEVKQEQTGMAENRGNCLHTMLPAASLTSVTTVRENKLLGEIGLSTSPKQRQAGEHPEQVGRVNDGSKCFC